MAAQETTVLKVDGMNCNSCVRHVDHALRELEGVADVKVDLDEGRAVVTHAGASVEAMIAALDEEGYPATQA